MKETLKDTISLVLLIVFFLPFLLLTAVIWIFGGWVKGWDYMPNPSDWLLDVLLDF